MARFDGETGEPLPVPNKPKPKFDGNTGERLPVDENENQSSEINKSNTPEGILNQIDSILEKQDTTEGGEASSETKPKAQTQMPTTPKRPTPSTGNMRTMMENTGQAQQVQQQETAARRSAANADYCEMYQTQQPATPQTPTTNARVAEFDAEKESAPRRPDRTPQAGTNASTNARGDMFDEEIEAAPYRRNVTPTSSKPDTTENARANMFDEERNFDAYEPNVTPQENTDQYRRAYGNVARNAPTRATMFDEEIEAKEPGIGSRLKDQLVVQEAIITAPDYRDQQRGSQRNK